MRKFYLLIIAFCICFISNEIYAQTYQLQIWNDQNGNGMFDGGEPGLPLQDVNVNVWLDSNSNGVLDGAETAIAGTSLGGGLFEYTLAGNGDYSVSYTEFPFYVSRYLQGGAVDSDIDPVTNVGTFTVTAMTPDPFTGFDLGLILASEVETFVWEDLNGDGIQDGGELGIGGGSFTLIDNGTGLQADDVQGNAVASVDQGGGNYTFSLLFPGNYSIDYGPTAPLLGGNVTYPTEMDQGGDDNTDSDVDKASLVSAAFVLNDDEFKDDVDAGFFLPATITTYVWDDVNGDGIQDGTETGITGIGGILLIDNMTGVQALDPDDIAINATDIGGGEYEFLLVTPGNYHIQYVLPPPPGVDPYIPTLAHYSGANGDDPNDIDDDSDADADDLSPTYLQSHAFDIESDEIEDEVDAGFILPAKITCYIWEDVNGDGIQDGTDVPITTTAVLLEDDGVTAALDLTGVAPVFTDLGGGLHEFSNLAPGDYIVEFSVPTIAASAAWYPTLVNYGGGDMDANDDTDDSDADNDLGSATYLQSHVIELAAEENEERVDAGFWVPGIVGNMVFCDKNGNGLFDGPDDGEGVELVNVTLVNDDTGEDPALDADGNPMTMMTDIAGMYLFDLVPPGNYYLNFEAPVGFELSPQDASGLSGAADVGDDSDADVGNGNTEVFEVLSQEDVEEADRRDAGMYQLIQIEGTIWLDENDDNLYTGEPGTAGVLVELFDIDEGMVIDMSTSFGGGAYQFMDLAPGNYRIILSASNFDTGMPLNGTISCEGNGDPADEIDNDDNGVDADPPPIQTVDFELLSNCDRNNPPVIEHIDFCFTFDCDAQNPLATQTCDAASNQVICNLPDLEGFCSRMYEEDSPGSQPSPLCPGQNNTAAHNISWFAFIAGEGSYTLLIEPFACSGSGGQNEGVQIGIYTTCDFDEAVFCNGSCNLETVAVPSDNLIPGETYYIFIDGCNGSICSYTIEIDGSYSNPTLFADDLCVGDDPLTADCNDITVCPNVDVELVLTGIDADIDYTWSVTVDAGGPYTGETAPMTTVAGITVTFENDGVYTVCMETGTNGCDFTQNPPRCRTITVESIEDEEFPDQFVCEGELDLFDIAVLSDTSVPENDPNGDGIFGWQAPTQTWVIGENTGMVTDANGCMYEQTFEIIELMHPPAEDVYMIFCVDELPWIFNGAQYTEADFIASPIISEPDLGLLIPASNGCDSTVNLVVELLDFNLEPLDPMCTFDGIQLTYLYAPGTTIPPDWVIDYEWTDPLGDPIVDDNLEPLDIIASEGSGIYSLNVTISRVNPVTMETVTCTLDPFEFNLNVDLFIPVDPIVDGPLVVCDGAVSTYVDVSAAFGVDYNWMWPSDADGTLSGPFNDTLTIDWTGSNGGLITVSSGNDCGQSGLVEITVDVTPQPTASFEVDPVVCVDSVSCITFTGDASMVDTYNWDFNNGTITNGTGGAGPGPHKVTWGSAGDTTITLTYTDLNGCVSTVATESVTIEQPIDAPVVTCDPAPIGSVIFTWDDVPGAGYSFAFVPDDGTYTGVLDGNTITVSGLGESETVTLILTTLTGTACNEVVSAEVSCTAQNCVPPVITVMSEISELCLDNVDSLMQMITYTTDPAEDPGNPGMAVFSSTGAGIDAATGAFDATVAGPGTHTITVTYTDPDGCIGTGNTTVIVKEVPTAAFTPDMDEICIDDEIMFIYSGTANPSDFIWDFGADVASSGSGPMPSASWTTPGEKTVTLTVMKDGCTSEPVSMIVTVQPLVEEIIVSCVDQESTSVTFSWNGVDGATGYSVSINGEPATTVTDTFWLEGGLVPMDEVTITVTAIMDASILCPAPSDSEMCVAMDCPDFESTFENMDLDICLTGSAPTVAIVLDVQVVGGGSTSGTFGYGGDPAVNPFSGVFDPNGLPAGPYNITVEYTETSTGCTHTNTITFNLIEQPDASFTLDQDDICNDEVVTVTFDGSGLNGADPAWVVSGGTITPTATTGIYEWAFTDAGSYTIDLTIDNQGCESVGTQQTVMVAEPESITNLMCSAAGVGELSISWDGASCATEYTILVDGVVEATQAGTTYLLTGLFNQEYTIEVQATSSCACEIVSATTMCTPTGCAPITVSLSADNQEWCMNGDLTPAVITPDVMGGAGDGDTVWSGDGDGNGGFDPATLAPGEYTVYFTYTETDCPPAEDSIKFTIFDVPSITAMVDNPICYTDLEGSVTFEPTGGVGPYTITVDGTVVTDPVAVFMAGTYALEVEDANGCMNTSSFTVTVPAPLDFDFENGDISGDFDVLTGSEQTYTIDPALVGGVMVENILWQSITNGSVYCDGADCFSMTQNFLANDSISVTITYNNGCQVQTAFEVTTKTITVIDVVNIFSPNGDGQNETFSIFTNDPDIVFNSVAIYDRWGNLMHLEPAWQGPGNHEVWDGRFSGSAVQPGVYIYTMEYIEGEGDGVRVKRRSGDFTIIR